MVIRDGDGNIVETYPITRMKYVDSVYTIPANGSFTTYYYEPSVAFSIGFKFYDDSGNLVTTRDRKVSLTINKFTDYALGKVQVITDTYSTNYEDNEMLPSAREFVGIETSHISGAYPYYNGVFKNLSSSSLKIRIVVSMD